MINGLLVSTQPKKEPEVIDLQEYAKSRNASVPHSSRGNVIESVRERRKYDSTGKSQLKKKRKQQLNSIVDKDVKRGLQTPGTELVSYEVSNILHIMHPELVQVASSSRN